MPDIAHDLVLAAFGFALVACIGILVRQTRERVQRSRNELLARKLDGFSTSLNAAER